MARRVRLAVGVLALLWLGASAGMAASDGSRVVSLPGQVRAFVDGELAARAVADPPPEADLREMRLSPAEGGGYTATLTFAADDWRRISTFGGQRATHQVFVSLQPPTGARMRVHLDSEGVATLDRAEGDRFVRVGDAVARADGPSVVFEIAPSVGMTADWEVQGHAFVRNVAGAGVHAHTAQVRAGSLTGEDGRTLRLPTAGTRLDRDSVPLLWQERVSMPQGTRPVSLAIARRTAGLSVDVTMDAPPVPATLDGGPAALQVIALVIGAPGPGSYTLLYNPVERSVFGAIDGGAAGTLDDDVVAVDGKIVRFRVPEISGGRALGPIDGAVPVARRVPKAQNDTPGQAGPAVPGVGPDTDLSVGGIVVGAQGGVAIESPVVPAGPLLPEAPASGGSDLPVIPILVGATVIVVVVAARRMMRSGGQPSVLDQIDDSEDGPSVIEEIEASDAAELRQRAERDCSELRERVRRLREELEIERSKIRDLELRLPAAQAELDDLQDTLGGAVRSEFGSTKEGIEVASGMLDAKDDAVERIEETLGRSRSALRSTEAALADAERRLAECLEARPAR